MTNPGANSETSTNGKVGGSASMNSETSTNGKVRGSASALRRRFMTRPRYVQKGGGRNLIVMGLAATVISLILTGFSLAIYHNSGDIYLDRSRPGFLPDEAEIDEPDNPVDEFNFQKNGTLNADVLDDYLKNLDLELQALDGYADPFSVEALSDETLGL